MLSNEDFEVTENSTSKSGVVSSLLVKEASSDSVGKFDCIAKNPFGAAEAATRAYSEFRAP